MKKLCVIVNVFGLYQVYIPLFVLSWLRAYPYVDIRIYLNDKIAPTVQRQLDLFNCTDRVFITENVLNLVGLSDKAAANIDISKCIRWLVYESVFEEYDALYIGDIDIIIAKESEDIFDQHMRHCRALSLPYSNIVRTKHFPSPYKPHSIVRNIMRYGARNMFRSLGRGRYVPFRLSGLHFINTTQYLSAIKPQLPIFTQHLNNMAEGRGTYNVVFFNNEALLYDMIHASGMGVPRYTSDNGYIYEQDPESEFFRPHHGIHVGIFRNAKDPLYNRGEWKGLVKSENYKSYYNDFLELCRTDEYKKIQPHFNEFLTEQLIRIHDVMGIKNKYS